MLGREEFREIGKVIYECEKFDIRAGDIFEGKTHKGHTNLIVALRVWDGYMYYLHGDKAKKVPLKFFIRAIENSDIELRYADEIDTERLSMAAIMLDAMANRRTFEESLHIQSEQAEEFGRRMVT